MAHSTALQQGRQQGRRNSLILVLPLATIALFTASASWTLFAVIGVHLKHSLDLNETTFAALLALPMLVGGLSALVLGALSPRLGARQVLLGCLVTLLLALGGFLLAETLPGFLLVGAAIGLAGGLFGAGLHYVASYCPPARAGLCLGCYSAGMLGAGFTYLMVPLMHSAYEWQLAPLAYIAITLLALLLLFILTDPEPDLKPNPAITTPASAPLSPPTSSLSPSMETLKPSPQRLYFCAQYAYLFGSFVALALWLPDYISAQYQLSLPQAAGLSLSFTLPGALSQIAGGALADRFGPIPVHRWVMRLALLILLFLSYPSTDMEIRGIDGPVHLALSIPLPLFLVLLMLLGASLGLGKGAQLRWLFDAFPGRTSSVGGAMLCGGCLLASTLPLLFGLSNDLLGVRSAAFMMLFGLAVIATWALEHSLRSAQRRQLFSVGPTALLLRW